MSRLCRIKNSKVRQVFLSPLKQSLCMCKGKPVYNDLVILPSVFADISIYTEICFQNLISLVFIYFVGTYLKSYGGIFSLGFFIMLLLFGLSLFSFS